MERTGKVSASGFWCPGKMLEPGKGTTTWKSSPRGLVDNGELEPYPIPIPGRVQSLISGHGVRTTIIT